MPKGSKKRKASKKKAHHHHHNPNNHDDAPHSSHNNGDDEMKHQEDKESDGEEVNSPTSQDNRNSQLDLTDGEKEEREKVDNRPHTPSSSDDSQSVDETTVHPEVVPVTVEVGGGGGGDEELKPEEQSNGETQNVEIVYNNSVSSQQPGEESAYNDVKATNELKEDKSNDVVVELVKESGDESLEKSSPVEKTAASEEEEEAPLISSYEAVNTLPESLPPATDAILVEEKSDAVEENGSVSEVDKKSYGDGIASGASVKIEDVTVPGITGNGEKEVVLLERGVDTPSVDLGSQKEGDEVVGKTDIAPSDSNLFASPLTEGNLTLSKNVTTSDVRNSAEQKKDIEVSGSSVHQPLLAAPPQPRTSWMNCCGLFEAFGGSSR